jgi:hypothetical protein
METENVDVVNVEPHPEGTNEAKKIEPVENELEEGYVLIFF